MVIILIKRNNFAKIKYRNVELGKFVAASYIKRTRDYRFCFHKWANIVALTKCVAASLAAIENSKKFLSSNMVSEVILHDKGYTPFGEFISESLHQNIAPIEVVAGHKDNTLMLRRNISENRDEHPASVSKKNFENFSNKLTDQELVQGRQEIVASYENGQWYSEVGTQKSAKFGLPYELKVNKGTSRYIAIFPHIFYDLTFFYGVDIFQNYFDWFENLIRFADEQKSVQWIIKSHPANLVKDQRDGVVSVDEQTHVKKILGRIPDHFSFIAADSEISTPELIANVDAICTVRGTVGLEGALAGKIVFTAGTGRYDRLGFTFDAETVSDYFSQLESYIANSKSPFSFDIKLAETYAFLLFRMRPFQLEGMTWEYPKNVNYNLRTQITDLSKFNNDITKLRDWLKSGDLEYLN